MRLLPVILIAALCPQILDAQRGRYMPPAAVSCSRDDLTSYTGEVTRYSRKDGAIHLTLTTDEQTVENVSLRPGDKVLLNAEPMKPEDWKQVEDKEGKLKAGMRATVWVCRGGRPVLDWQPPPK